MFDLFREIGQTLGNNKLRTVLTGIAVAWGIFMLMVLLGMGRGVYNSFVEHVSRGEVNSLSVWGGLTSSPYKGYKEGRRISLKETDIKVIEEENRDFVENVSARVPLSGTISTPDNYVSYGAKGVSPGYLKENGMKLVAGRFISDLDIKEKRKAIVISKENAGILFPEIKELDNIIGKRVVLNSLGFTVVGIFSAEFDRNSYIPFSVAMMMRGNDGVLNQINVNLKNVNSVEDGEAAEKQVRATLASVHEFKQDDDSAIWIWNQFTSYLTSLTAMNVLNMVIWIIGILTMLSGIVGVSNIMFVSVRERTHEIGIRRAIGARPKNILVQILTESVVITGLFGYIGIFLGICATETIKAVFGDSDFISNPTVDISIAIETTILLIISGALAGLFPALKALKVKPVEALRDE